MYSEDRGKEMNGSAIQRLFYSVSDSFLSVNIANNFVNASLTSLAQIEGGYANKAIRGFDVNVDVTEKKCKKHIEKNDLVAILQYRMKLIFCQYFHCNINI